MFDRLGSDSTAHSCEVRRWFYTPQNHSPFHTGVGRKYNGEDCNAIEKRRLRQCLKRRFVRFRGFILPEREPLHSGKEGKLRRKGARSIPQD